MNPVVPQQRYGDGSTNYLDVDLNAYPTLTGAGPWESVGFSKSTLQLIL